MSARVYETLLESHHCCGAEERPHTWGERLGRHNPLVQVVGAQRLKALCKCCCKDVH